jgi:putative DNA primase/helicase
VHSERATPYVDTSVRRRYPDIAAVYEYRDEHGQHLLEVVRDVEKGFRQRRRDDSKPGGWDWRVTGVRRVLYRLPELLAAPLSAPIYVVEGEKDVESLRKRGFFATCNIGGAGKWSGVEACAAVALKGRNIVLISDLDDEKQGFAGQKHAKQAADHIRKVAASVVGPMQCTKGHDITDHLEAGGTLDELVPVVWGSAPAKPSAAVDAKSGTRPKLSIVKDGPAWDDHEPADPGGDRPEVKIGKDIHRVIADLDRVVGGSDPLLFQRDHEIVAVAGSRVKEGTAQLHAGTPIIRQLSAASLLPRITEHVRTFSWKKVKNKDTDEELMHKVDVLPPPAVLSSFLGALDWLHVRPISGITECPTIRPDGSVMQTPGYDAVTGYLYTPNGEYPRVDDEPTHSDAVRAYAHLAEVFCDFPYVDPSHLSAVVASIIAIIVRPAIEGSVPAFVQDASSRRSGKTLQVDVISLITCGRPASRMTYPEDDEELEKVMASYAMIGARMINFDNIEGMFGGPALDKCITAIDTVDLRVLGVSQLKTLTWRAVVFASGNNVRGRGDILERVLAPRLESPLEHPEKRDLRTLRHPRLRDWTRENRARLVHCALTIIRAYCVAGRPKQSVENWGGFEAFTELVVHALVWVGAPNPLGARRGGDADEDPARVAERTLVHGWDALCRSLASASLSVSAAIRALYPPPKKDEPPDGHDDVREAIAELTRAPSGFAPDTRKLGDAVRKLKRKPYDGLRFESDGSTGGVARWKVVRSS